ncbi:MAG: hypothetical protein AAFU53_14005 [Cyanobacteria bacterium J06632_3]
MATQAFQISILKDQIKALELEKILSIEEVYRYVEVFDDQPIQAH